MSCKMLANERELRRHKMAISYEFWRLQISVLFPFFL